MQQISSFQQEYNRLNEEQKKAVDSIEGPLLVLAGPGTGKTQLLAIRAANILLKKKIIPEAILILTFTNAAVQTMRQRLAQIIGHEGYSIIVETFHGFANSIVLESEFAIKYVKDKIEISEVEKVRAIEYILDNVKGAASLRPFGAPYIHRKEIEKRISELKNEGISPDEFERKLEKIKVNEIIEAKDISRLRALAYIYKSYEELKDVKGSVLFDERGRRDYDDMILTALEALKKEKELCDLFRKNFKYIMVDEYQDTNGAQLELLFSVLNPHTVNICCVGDDDQAIYRFQGATLSNFRLLKEALPALKTIVLKDNYRSTEDIISASGRIISQLPNNERIITKVLSAKTSYDKGDISFSLFMTEEEELAHLVEEIERQVETIKKNKSLSSLERERPFNNIAVLLRKRDYILKIIDAFLKKGIPYATDGEEDIRLEKRVRQMLDALELAHVDTESNQKKALALYKVLSADYMGICHSDILSFIEFVNNERRLAKEREPGEYGSINLFLKFQEHFAVFSRESNAGEILEPRQEETNALEILKALKLKNPHALHKAAWAITRLIRDSRTRPVHDILMGYIEDTHLYRYILKRYEKDNVLRIRDLRALVSFVNMVKNANLASPSMRLDVFFKELELREIHGLPLQGELATLNQDGVRILTAHKAKGLEFYTVFIPFCLDQKSWPLRRKPDIISLPSEIYKSKEHIEEKSKIKLLETYDELRLFYVASTRAKAHLIYTAAPVEKLIVSPFMAHLALKEKGAPPIKEEEFLVRFLEKKPREDSLAGTSKALAGMVSQLALNPTSINNYIACRRKFLYDNVLTLPGRKTQHIVFGNSVHKALEEIYSMFKKEKRFPSFSVFKDFFKKEIEYQGVNDEMKIWCLDRLNTLEPWYKIESSSPVVPIALEEKIEITLPGGILFKGVLDKIEKEKENEIRVIDYKTGKPDNHVKKLAACSDLSSYECDDYLRQLIAYKMLYESLYCNKESMAVTKGVLHFLEPVSTTIKKYGLEKGEYLSLPVDLKDEMVVRFKEIVINCWKDIKALRFEKLAERDDKDRCERCPYDSICWGD